MKLLSPILTLLCLAGVCLTFADLLTSTPETIYDTVATTVALVAFIVGAALSVACEERIQRLKIGPNGHAVLGTLTILIAIATSEKASAAGDTLSTLIWAAITLLGLYFGFKELGRAELTRRCGH